MRFLTRRIGLLVALLLVAVAIMLPAQTATITDTRGKVEVLQDNQWRAAATGDNLPLGATISTGFNSSATLAVGNATLQVRPLSRMRIEELVEREGVLRTDVSMRVGRVRADVRAAEGLTNDFQIRSTVSTASVRGTEFEFDGFSLEVGNGTVRLINNAANQGPDVPAGEGAKTSQTGVTVAGSGLREENSAVQVKVISFEELGGELLDRDDEAGTGAITIEWEF
jgi:hypothetical protein